MDKTEYCDTMEERLRSLEQYLASLDFPTPATLEAARQQREKKRVVESLRDRIAETLQMLAELRADADSEWSSAKRDVDRRWEEIAEMRRSVG